MKRPRSRFSSIRRTRVRRRACCSPCRPFQINRGRSRACIVCSFETLDLAKLRAVDAEALGEIGHYIPALFFAFNTNDEVVSTDFAQLTR